MVYRLTTMSKKTLVVFFIVVWIFSAICAILGTIFIVSAALLPNTPYRVQYNPILIDIRQEMGPWIGYGYFDFEADIHHPNVIITPQEGDIKAFLENGDEIKPFNIWNLIEERENGSVRFILELSVLEFDFFNGTLYQVEAEPEHIIVDIPHKEIKLKYQHGKSFPIVYRKAPSFEDDKEWEEKIIGDYFRTTSLGWAAWFQEIIREIRENFWYGFMDLGGVLLVTVAIGGGWGIIIALILIITRLSKLFGGKYITYLILKALNGKIGKILNFVPIFDFNGDFYVEERFVNVIDFSGFRSSFIELFKQRWYDILVFPTALASILTIIFVQNFTQLNPIFSIFNIHIDGKMEALALSPLLTPIILIVVLFYFPLIWAFNEGGFKRLQISPQGDVIAVKPLGKILRDGLGIIIGFSGILSLGALAMEVNSDLARKSTSTGQIQVAGFTLDYFGLSLLVLWTLGLFLILLGSIIVGASVLAVNYLQKDHLNTIEYLRSKSEKHSIITNWGSVTHQFSPVAKKALYEKMEKQN